MRKIPYLWIGLLGCLILLVIFVFGPYFPKVDKNVTEHKFIVGNNGNLDFILPPFPPSKQFPFGTDSKGKDMYSALIVGTRETLSTVGLISVITFLFALPLGIGAAHFRFLSNILKGWNYLFGRVPLFFYIVLLTTIPFFVFSTHRPIWMIALLILLEVGKVADFVFKSVSGIQQTAYYDAAVVSGTRVYGLFKWYYWPGCLSQWLSYFIQHMALILFLLGQLGFFSIFVSQKFEPIGGFPDMYTIYAIVNTSIVWPTFLSHTFNDIYNCPWVPMYACLFISFAILSLTALGKGISQYSLLKQKGIIFKKQRSANHKFIFRKNEVITK